MVLQTAQCVQWDGGQVIEGTGGLGLRTSPVPSTADASIPSTRTPRKDRQRSRGDYELAWTRIGSELDDDGEHAKEEQSSAAPGTDTEASDDDSPHQAKSGREYLEVVETDDAHDAVANWPIQAIGRRPIDYVGRELLHGSLLRDHRPRFFHKYVAEPAEWMLPLMEHVADDRQAKIATQHLALHFLHRRHLLHRIEDQLEVGEFADERDCALLADLWCCTPYGVLVDWVGEEERSVGKRCNRAWYCPWCFGRHVVDLYERLKDGPLRRPTGKHLVLGRVYVPANLYDTLGDDLNPAESRALRTHLGGLMRDELLHLGVTGGLLTYQLGPWMQDVSPTSSERLPTFQHELAVLGEIELTGPEGEARLIRELEAIKLGSHPRGNALRVEWVVMPAEQKEALRLLLVGCGPEFDLGRVQWFTGQDTDYLARKGIWGAFALQPLFMLDGRQWQFYRMAVDNMHLYDLFGSWRRLARRDEGPVMTDQQRAFQVVNSRKRREVEERRALLLDLVKSHGLPKTHGSCGRRGRPGRRQQIVDLLAKHKEEANDRDLRWLGKVLSADGIFVRTGSSGVDREEMPGKQGDG